ncbi:hypothetical protein D5086_017544 [Populus alba]|uniref:Uncharacterized protein n=1 Tax=Populus alba TaxID=43335 RepID=A0ACC4BMN2_POPAL
MFHVSEHTTSSLTSKKVMSEREEIVFHASDEQVGRNLGVVSSRRKRGEDAEYYPSAPLALPRRPHHIHSSPFLPRFPRPHLPSMFVLFTRLPSLLLSSFIAHLQAEQSRADATSLLKSPEDEIICLSVFILLF